MIPSPCISVCRIRPSAEFCIGCARSRDEIAGWLNLTDDQKNAVWSALPERRAQMGLNVHRLAWNTEDLRAFIRESFRPNGGTWVSGVNGAIAEFCVCADDDLQIESDDRTIVARTRGGAISLSLPDYVAALAIGSAESASHGVVVLAVPRVLTRRFGDGGFANLGEDTEAIQPDDRKATLYDFGLGRAAGAFCVRTSSQTLRASLDECLGVEWQRVMSLKGADILAESPVRVVRNPIGADRNL